MEIETTLWAWIHLSDIHFGHGSKPYQADQEDLISLIQSDVKDVLGKGSGVPQPQAILLTGDVAFSGGIVRGAEEYAEAVEFVSKLQKSLRNEPPVFAIPGNHDVQRTTETSPPNAVTLLKVLRDPKSSDNLDEAVTDTEKAALLRGRFKNFAEFCKQIGSPVADGADGFWIRELEIGKGLKVHLIGLNTALLCNDDFDKGVLNIPHATSTKAFLEIPKEELVFVLTHHPVDWLNPTDKDHLTQKIRRNCSVHFHGHIHAPESQQITYGTGESTLIITAGAVHADEAESKSGTPDTYSFGALVELDDGSIAVRIWPRRWAPIRGIWVQDSERLPEGADYAQHILRRPTASLDVEAVKFLYEQARDLLKAWSKRIEDGAADLVVPIRSCEYLDAAPAQVSPDLTILEQRRQDLIDLSKELFSFADGGEKIDPNDTHLGDVTARLRSLLEAIYHQRLTFKGEKRAATGSEVTVRQVIGDLLGTATAMEGDVRRGATANVHQEIKKVGRGASATTYRGDVG